ncbi:hypothetical protein BKA69DRAFT_537718 [Paraphysoderma sedebokerense]|nr:hypothetical protein BKA69DRAFT_537718 [Paraphysoderma sedebokerense]
MEPNLIGDDEKLNRSEEGKEVDKTFDRNRDGRPGHGRENLVTSTSPNTYLSSSPQSSDHVLTESLQKNPAQSHSVSSSPSSSSLSYSPNFQNLQVQSLQSLDSLIPNSTSTISPVELEKYDQQIGKSAYKALLSRNYSGTGAASAVGSLDSSNASSASETSLSSGQVSATPESPLGPDRNLLSSFGNPANDPAGNSGRTPPISVPSTKGKRFTVAENLREDSPGSFSSSQSSSVSSFNSSVVSSATTAPSPHQHQLQRIMSHKLLRKTLGGTSGQGTVWQERAALKSNTATDAEEANGSPEEELGCQIIEDDSLSDSIGNSISNITPYPNDEVTCNSADQSSEMPREVSKPSHKPRLSISLPNSNQKQIDASEATATSTSTKSSLTIMSNDSTPSTTVTPPSSSSFPKLRSSTGNLVRAVVALGNPLHNIPSNPSSAASSDVEDAPIPLVAPSDASQSIPSVYQTFQTLPTVGVPIQLPDNFITQPIDYVDPRDNKTAPAAEFDIKKKLIKEIAELKEKTDRAVEVVLGSWFEVSSGGISDGSVGMRTDARTGVGSGRLIRSSSYPPSILGIV